MATAVVGSIIQQSASEAEERRRRMRISAQSLYVSSRAIFNSQCGALEMCRLAQIVGDYGKIPESLFA